MSAKQSSESRDESPTSIIDAGSLALLLEHAGVGYDRSEDRPFSLRQPPSELVDEGDLPMSTLREPDPFFAEPDTEVEFLDDGRPTDRPPPPSTTGEASEQASDDGPDITDPGGLPPA